MNRKRRSLLIQLGLLACVVLLTAGVIRSYGSRSQELLQHRSESSNPPQIIGILLDESARFFIQKRYPEAEHFLRQILNHDRNNITAMRMLGNVYFLSGRYFEAGSAFRAVLAKRPKDPAAHANLGETLIRMQWYKAGIRELLTARAIDPELPDIDLRLSRAYEEIGNTAAAEQYRKFSAERAARSRNRPEPDKPQRETPETESASAESQESNHEPN